jgi:hypothetical protein
MSIFPSVTRWWDAVPGTTGEVSMQDTGTRAIHTWAAGFAAQAANDAEVAAFVDLVDRGILDAIPELADDPMIVHDLHESTRHHILAFMAALGRPEHELRIPVQAEDLVRTLARRGKDLPVLLKIYREAHSGVFAYFSQTVDQLDETAPPREEVLKFLWPRTDSRSWPTATSRCSRSPWRTRSSCAGWWSARSARCTPTRPPSATSRRSARPSSPS